MGFLMKHNRLVELDALRGIAALAVVLYHYFYRYNQLYDHRTVNVDWLYFGKYGAQFFFIISGFVIYWTLNNIEKPMDFLVSRFSRLYPVFWVSLFITFSAVSLFGLSGKNVSLTGALLNLLMFHEYFGTPHIDGVYWTLTVELTFYFWVFILYLFRQLKNAELWMTPVLLLTIMQAKDIIELPVFVNRLFLVYHINFFIAGIGFYKLVNKKATRLTPIIIIFSLLSTAVTISVKHFILFSFFYSVFFFAVSSRLKFLSFKPFVFLGAISYSLYLLHQNIGFIIINKFNEHHLNPNSGAVLSLLLCITIASLLNKYIEKPSLIFIRNVYKHNSRIQQFSKLFLLRGKKTSKETNAVEPKILPQPAKQIQGPED